MKSRWPGPLVLAAAVVVFLAACGGSESRPLPEGRAMSATWSLTPPAALFGDPVDARVDLLVDREKLDPAQIRFEPDFTPFEPVGKPSFTQRDIGGFTHLRYEWTLRCISFGCIKVIEGGPVAQPGLPPPTTGSGGFGERKTVKLKSALISYERANGKKRALRRITWPTMQSVSRLNFADTSTVGIGFPFRASTTPLPDATFRVSPWLLGAALIVGAAALLAFAAIVFWRILRREPAPVVEDTGTELTPLERALQLVEWAQEQPNGVERRKALEVLATELSTNGSPELAEDARGLAWSAAPPSPEATGNVVERVREADGSPV